jgi:hypothetical protein
LLSSPSNPLTNKLYENNLKNNCALRDGDLVDFLSRAEWFDNPNSAPINKIRISGK